MQLSYSPLTALSPLEGRYFSKSAELREFFSEYALIKYRYQVELSWFLSLAQNPQIKELAISSTAEDYLNELINNFDENTAQKIKDLEKITNHDVKAVEYQIRSDFEKNAELKNYLSFIHFSCTSEDINNLAYALMLNEGRDFLLNSLSEITEKLGEFAKNYATIPMLSHTHGQAASPTTLGKEFNNVLYRLNRQIKQLEKQEILGKINGAVGNFNAHCVAYPQINWAEFAEEFVKSILGLTYNPLTTQIEPHDYIAELLHNLSRINTILLDLCRDIWTYISMGYFGQKVVKGEVGSSTMPHKVNPIDFENAEGNFGLSNAMALHLATKLPVSRMQRDLTDSTVLRSLGTVFGYMEIALASLKKGLGKLEINAERLLADLTNNPEVLTEAIQTVMRRYGIDDAYEQLKALSRGKKISLNEIKEFIKTLKIPDEAKKLLIELEPHSYLGMASQLAILDQ